MSEEKVVDVNEEMALVARQGITRIDLTLPARRISEVLEEIAPQGTKVLKDEVEEQDIIIRSIEFFRGKFGAAGFVVFTNLEGELFNTILGGKVMLPKLWLIKDQLPVVARLVRREGGQKEYYWDIE